MGRPAPASYASLPMPSLEARSTFESPRCVQARVCGGGPCLHALTDPPLPFHAGLVAQVELMEQFGRNIAKNGALELDSEGEPIELLGLLGEGSVSCALDSYRHHP